MTGVYASCPKCKTPTTQFWTLLPWHSDDEGAGVYLWCNQCHRLWSEPGWEIDLGKTEEEKMADKVEPLA